MLRPMQQPAPLMMTYWLYWGSKVVGSVRLPAGMCDEAVRGVAIDWNRRVPLRFEDMSPGEYELVLEHATVQRH